MRIAVDVDGVLADRVGGVLGHVRERYGVELRTRDVDEWEFVIPGTETTITEAIETAAVDDPEHLLDLTPVDGAAAALRRLAADHSIVIATHRDPAFHGLTRRWLGENGIPHDAFVEECGRGKVDVDADVLVDDYPRNVRSFARERGRAVLFHQPWNAAVADEGDLVVAKRWSDVLDVVGEWADY